MGVFDQAARYAAQADPAVVPHQLQTRGLQVLPFRDWFDTRATPLPGGRDRTADLVAILDDPRWPHQPWLLVVEFQAQHDPYKLDVTLHEVALLRCHARHGEERRSKYRVLAGLVYLRGVCPESDLDMTTPEGEGVRHRPLLWEVARDDAGAMLDGVEAGRLSWGILFWVPLMKQGGEEALVERWRKVVERLVPDGRTRGDLVGIALVFAELAGCVPVWRRVMKGFEMTESQIVNEWMKEGEDRGDLRRLRLVVNRVLKKKFPEQVTADVIRLIEEQESVPLLESWLDQATLAITYEQFLDYLKK